jgi:hypothetical protein
MGIEEIKVIGGIAVAILGVIFGGKLLFKNNSKSINQKKGDAQIAMIDSNKNEVNVGDYDKSQKKN